MVAESGDCNGRTLTYDPNTNPDTKDDSSPEEDMDDDVGYRTLNPHYYKAFQRLPVRRGCSLGA